MQTMTDTRSVIESLNRTGIKRYAMKRSTLAETTSPCISSFLQIDGGRRDGVEGARQRGGK